jgi:multidrug efflux pump subunit AcrA (membrane-fusion protein)
MKRSLYVLSAAGVLFLSSTVQFLRSRERPVDAAPASSTIRRGLISAPGRVEAVSEEIRVSSELSGRLHSVPVEEGERIHRGAGAGTNRKRRLHRPRLRGGG